MAIYRRPLGGVAAGDAIPFFHAGDYHLFHLSSPKGTTSYPERVRTTWSHAKSKDLVQWEELPAALPPGELEAPDADGAWTGSVVDREGVFHIFYTGHKIGSETPQTICHATSRDLVSFVKNPANPIIRPDRSLYESIDWRDPYLLWNAEERVYWMLIAARLREGPRWRRGCIALATSADLTAWTLDPQPFYAPMTTFCPECPELFQIGDRWYLVYSRFSENAATIYRVGDSPRGPWRVPKREALDGRRWYAAKSMPKGDSARIYFGWVHDRAGRTNSGAWLWGGDFTAPREVVADPSGELIVRLPKEVSGTYSKPLPFTIEGATAASATLALSTQGGFASRFIKFDVTQYIFRCHFGGADDPATFGLLFRSDREIDAYALIFDSARATVTLTHWPQPLDTFWADLVGRSHEIREVDGSRLAEQPLRWDISKGGVSCTLLVDDDVLEFYVNDEIAILYRVYRRSPVRTGCFC